MLNFNRRQPAWLFLGCLVAAAVPSARAESWRVRVSGGEIELGETPIVVKLTQPLTTGLYQMETQTHAGPVACDAQVFRHGDTTFLGFVLPGLPGGASADFTLEPRSQTIGQTSAGLSFAGSETNLTIKLNDKLLTNYRVGDGNKPFFYPLVGPTDASYTRGFPMTDVPGDDHDHPHQRSCWFTYGNLDGVDFWSEGKKFGTIAETSRKLVVAGPHIGRMATTDIWRAADGRKICDDERTVTFYQTKGARLIDFDFRLIASEGPVTFRDTKEGMFGIRVASSMDVNKKKGGKITNAEGLTDEKAWGKASTWVDYVGPVDDKTVGIAIINRPDSFRFPTTWHVRTYGLFAANPFGWHDFGKAEKGDFTLAAGQSISFSYRVILHEGDTRAAHVAELASAYLKPPSVHIEPR